MLFNLRATAAESRALLTREFLDPAPEEAREDVNWAIDLVINEVDHGGKLIYNDYLGLELVIERDR